MTEQPPGAAREQDGEGADVTENASMLATARPIAPPQGISHQELAASVTASSRSSAIRHQIEPVLMKAWPSTVLRTIGNAAAEARRGPASRPHIRPRRSA